jgi:hypothetical protein
MDKLALDSRQVQENFLFPRTYISSIRPSQPPIQWIPGVLSLGVKRPGLEADNSPPSSAEVNSERNYTSTAPICLYGVEWEKSTFNLLYQY